MPVKHCDRHTKYTAGCPWCQQRSKIYQAEFKSRNGKKISKRQETLAFSSTRAMWEKMTEIGLRWERR